MSTPANRLARVLDAALPAPATATQSAAMQSATMSAPCVCGDDERVVAEEKSATANEKLMVASPDIRQASFKPTISR